MKPASAKAKGRELQKYIRDRIYEAFAWLKEGDVTSTAMGQGGVDIQLSPLARRTFPLSIESKKTKKTPSGQELEQARRNAYGMTLPVVAWCPHGKGPQHTMLLMSLEDFIDWYKDISAVKLDKIEQAEGAKDAKHEVD